MATDAHMRVMMGGRGGRGRWGREGDKEEGQGVASERGRGKKGWRGRMRPSEVPRPIAPRARLDAEHPLCRDVAEAPQRTGRAAAEPRRRTGQEVVVYIELLLSNADAQRF